MDFLTNPFVAALLVLYQILAHNMVLTIIAFTALVKLITHPLTITQIRSSKRMQELAPQLAKIKEKYKGDRERFAQEQMKLYKENGVNPLAGCLPLLIQLPILFGLYGAINAALAATPLQLLDMYHRLLIPTQSTLVPLEKTFLWMNLGQPDPSLILPILVVATTWLQSKLMTPTPTDPKDPSAAMSRNMTVMMPIMIGLFSLSFASGLSLYWIASNIFTIVQYTLIGKIDIRQVFAKQPATAPALASSGAPKKAIESSDGARPKKSIAASSDGASAGAAAPKRKKIPVSQVERANRVKARTSNKTK